MNVEKYSWCLTKCTLAALQEVPCNGHVAHLLVTEDSRVVGCACEQHKRELDNGYPWDMAQTLQRVNGSKVSAAPLLCPSCGELHILQRGYEIQRYEGPICSQCKRTAMLVEVTSSQTDTIKAALEELVKSQRLFAEFNKSIAAELKGRNEMAAKPVKTLVEKVRESPVVKTLEVDATDAAWRMAGSQFVKLTREPVVAILSRHLGPDDESLRGRIASFLETELGAAILSGVLSAGLSAMQRPANDVSQRLARELRVRSMATAGDALADVLMAPLRQVVVTHLSVPPAPVAQLVESTRVEVPVPVNVPVEVPVAVPVKKSKKPNVWAGES